MTFKRNIQCYGRTPASWKPTNVPDSSGTSGYPHHVPSADAGVGVDRDLDDLRHT